jgi:hypothetical protein
MQLLAITPFGLFRMRVKKHSLFKTLLVILRRVTTSLFGVWLNITDIYLYPFMGHAPEGKEVHAGFLW